ncbi:Ras guanine nucleotide exchange factor A [Exophiala dermatitidis]
MRNTRPSSVYASRLRIFQDGNEESYGATTSSNANRMSTARLLDSAVLDETRAPRARFHNYLRALYPFQPAASQVSTTVTLPLNAGDLILVHSVHVNGWADGTLLDTGARGWLPTNYCEAYDHAAMRPLLKALTDFWDLVRCGGDSNLNVFRNQDYMRGLVAGVRALLERCQCLARNAALVKEHEGIRRTRKNLLSDLAWLVKAARLLQQKVGGQSPHRDLDIRLDDMLLKAFKIVMRAALFFDAWIEQTTSDPVDAWTRAESSALSASQETDDGRYRRESVAADTTPISPKPAVMRRHSSLTHRMSYTTPKNSKLISECLHRTYDDFLTVLASFLGSHLQSRSSSELLATTQNAVRSCRQLFVIVETVIERDHNTSRPLVQAKDALYDAITELVHSAREVFKPFHTADEDIAYLPDEAHNLLQAATACVSAAGRCVARTKATLEEIGDFEIEDLAQLFGRASDGSNTRDSAQPETVTAPRCAPEKGPVEEVSENKKAGFSISQGMLSPPLSFNSAGSPPTAVDTSRTSKPNDNVQPRHLPVSHRDKAVGVSQSDAHAQSSRLQVTSGSDRHRRLSCTRPSTASTRINSVYEADPPAESWATTPTLGGSFSDEDAEAEILVVTFAQELVFNREGAVVGGTLNALVERLTTHDSTSDPVLSSTIYLTFRQFTTPEEFAQALAYRFEYVGANPNIASAVRLRVYNVLTAWMESYWRHDCDDTAFPVIVGFAREQLRPVLPMACQRILELADIVSSAQSPILPRPNTSYTDSPGPLPSPIISKSQLTALRTWKMGGGNVSILDFDPLELARQITLKTSKIFCSILPEELLGTEWTKRTSSLAVNVRAMSTLSTDVSNLVSDSVLQLEEPKKRAVIIKQWVKIANKCLELHNYDTVMAIVCALDSTNIKRMKKTWEFVPQKTKLVFDELCKVVDVSKNYSVLRHRVQSHVPPCLPFIGVYLTDLTMVDSANPATRPLSTDAGEISVINLDKHIKTTKIISELQRFQVPYRFSEISELQAWMRDQLVRVRSVGEKSFQMHYRRSLVLEPREPNKSPNPEAQQSNKEREKFDFLQWTHLLPREKSVSVSS